MVTEQFFVSNMKNSWQDNFREHFENTFEYRSKPRGKLFLKNGETQSSLKAKNATFDTGAGLFLIPLRSPGIINPIESHPIAFHPVKNLNRNALEQNRTQESYHQFSERAKETILNFPVAFLDNNWICG